MMAQVPSHTRMPVCAPADCVCVCVCVRVQDGVGKDKDVCEVESDNEVVIKDPRREEDVISTSSPYTHALHLFLSVCLCAMHPGRLVPSVLSPSAVVPAAGVSAAGT